MTGQQEPEFLTREIVDAIHEEQISTFGGLHGVRDENALESAIAAVQDVYHYGNKRTGVQASLVFLEGCGIDTGRLPEQRTYDMMIKIETHQAGRSDFADYLRSELTNC